MAIALSEILRKEVNAKIILRCDDTNPNIDYNILSEIVKMREQYFGISMNVEGFIKQSSRNEVYQEYLDQLREKGILDIDKEWCHVFDIEKYTSLFGPYISVEDALLWKMTFDVRAIMNNSRYFRVSKSDWWCLYNFASAVDDGEMQVTHIVRWQDKLSTMPFQEMIKNALDFTWEKLYVHLPMLLTDENMDNHGFHGNADYKSLLKIGILSQTINSYIFSSGYGAPEKIYMSTYDFFNNFSIEGLHKWNSKFDYNKLIFINKKMLLQISDEDYYSSLKNYLHINEYYIALHALKRTDIKKLLCSLRKELYETKDLILDIINPVLRTSDLSNIHQKSYYSLKRGNYNLQFDNLDTLAHQINIDKRTLFETIRWMITGKVSGPSIEILLNCLYPDWTVPYRI